MLKLYAWEPSFENQVLKIRDKEIKVLREAAYLNAGTSFIWSCAPFLVSYLFVCVFDQQHSCCEHFLIYYNRWSTHISKGIVDHIRCVCEHRRRSCFDARTSIRLLDSIRYIENAVDIPSHDYCLCSSGKCDGWLREKRLRKHRAMQSLLLFNNLLHRATETFRLSGDTWSISVLHFYS